MLPPLMENVCWSFYKISTAGKFVMNFQRWLKNFCFFEFLIAFSNFFKKFQQHKVDTYLSFLSCKKNFFLGWTVWEVFKLVQNDPFFCPKISKIHIFFLVCPRAKIFGMVVVQGVPFRCAKFRPEVPLPVAPLILI